MLKICPFDGNHAVQPRRFQAHLLKCRAQHPEVKLASCIFNATHMVPFGARGKHIEECPDSGDLVPFLLKVKRLKTAKVNKSHENNSNDPVEVTWNSEKDLEEPEEVILEDDDTEDFMIKVYDWLKMVKAPIEPRSSIEINFDPNVLPEGYDPKGEEDFKEIMTLVLGRRAELDVKQSNDIQLMRSDNAPIISGWGAFLGCSKKSRDINLEHEDEFQQTQYDIAEPMGGQEFSQYETSSCCSKTSIDFDESASNVGMLGHEPYNHGSIGSSYPMLSSNFLHRPTTESFAVNDDSCHDKDDLDSGFLRCPPPQRGAAYFENTRKERKQATYASSTVSRNSRMRSIIEKSSIISDDDCVSMSEDFKSAVSVLTSAQSEAASDRVSNAGSPSLKTSYKKSEKSIDGNASVVSAKSVPPMRQIIEKPIAVGSSTYSESEVSMPPIALEKMRVPKSRMQSPNKSSIISDGDCVSMSDDFKSAVSPKSRMREIIKKALERSDDGMNSFTPDSPAVNKACSLERKSPESSNVKVNSSPESSTVSVSPLDKTRSPKSRMRMIVDSQGSVSGKISSAACNSEGYRHPRTGSEESESKLCSLALNNAKMPCPQQRLFTENTDLESVCDESDTESFMSLPPKSSPAGSSRMQRFLEASLSRQNIASSEVLKPSAPENSKMKSYDALSDCSSAISQAPLKLPATRAKKHPTISKADSNIRQSAASKKSDLIPTESWTGQKIPLVNGFQSGLSINSRARVTGVQVRSVEVQTDELIVGYCCPTCLCVPPVHRQL